jgi:orotidine-5'-phosphate decarboxylase
MVADAGAKTFLDLKFFDIPNTVSRAIRSVSRHEISMVNVHCLGGNAMMRAAKEAALSSRAGPLVLGVTILTSLDGKDLSDIGFPHSPQDAVLLLARNAKAAGLDGVISSPHEVNMLRRELGGDFVLVTPGVRPAWSEAGDQKRVMTPREAIDAGADYIVVGRPIVASSDIRGAAQRVIEEISS